MDVGNLKKYLFYAIGEILLVVIGILIAIQLNNFNEQRRSENNGTLVLGKLKQELEQDITYFNSLSVQYDLWYSQTKYILDTVLTGEVSELKSLDQYNIGRGSMNFLHINKRSFNELINSGSNIEIRNKSLKNKIEEYFQFADIELKKINSDNEMFYKWVLDNIDLVLWHKLWANRNLKYENWSWLKNPSSEKFRKSEGYVLFFQNAIKANQTLINSLREKNQIIVRMIEDELKR